MRVVPEVAAEAAVEDGIFIGPPETGESLITVLCELAVTGVFLQI